MFLPGAASRMNIRRDPHLSGAVIGGTYKGYRQHKCDLAPETHHVTPCMGPSYLYGTISVNSARIVQSDQVAGQSVVHVVDKLMFLPGAASRMNIRRDPHLSSVLVHHDHLACRRSVLLSFVHAADASHGYRFARADSLANSSLAGVFNSVPTSLRVLEEPITVDGKAKIIRQDVDGVMHIIDSVLVCPCLKNKH
ncbi:hypothetical protein NP493_118g05039 [Ridgeia piscesae]|uniref:FAS1 domain-containing protein n=1 Tax=Ridgeia piscesae TaxID=27915 RepID=A0AAD9P6E5_RIDPI|nr:hypothetical protein NP493_118g05039 [Ridgeia piscesae]